GEVVPPRTGEPGQQQQPHGVSRHTAEELRDVRARTFYIVQRNEHPMSPTDRSGDRRCHRGYQGKIIRLAYTRDPSFALESTGDFVCQPGLTRAPWSVDESDHFRLSRRIARPLE